MTDGSRHGVNFNDCCMQHADHILLKVDLVIHNVCCHQ